MTFNQTEVAMIVSYLLNPNILCSYSNPTATDTGIFTAYESADKSNNVPVRNLQLKSWKHTFTIKAINYEAAALIAKTYELVESSNEDDMQRLRDAKSILLLPEFFAISRINSQA